MLSHRLKIASFYVLSLLFLAAHLLLVIRGDFLWLSVLPLGALFVFFALYRMDYLLLGIAFFTPLSLPLKEVIPGLSFDLNLPTEPLVVALLAFFLLKLAQSPRFDKRILYNPLIISVCLYMGWMLLTSLTSSMILVSVKYWVSKLWFIVGFLVFGFALFRKGENFTRFVLLYGCGFVFVIAYAWWRQSSYGFFDNQAANFVMNPFFKDHTSYGAMLVFFIPSLFVIAFQKERQKGVRYLAGALLGLFTIALVFSYTRAAWLSLGAAAGFLVLLVLKVRFRTILLISVCFVVLLGAFQSQLFNRLKENKQQSSSQLAGHLNSMSNVTTDASNVERLNRWSSALDMFAEKPVFGWGPGTYMFQYAPFQKTSLRTIISTNSGDVGNAHSEYLGPLAESGLLGMLSVILLFFTILKVGMRVYEQTVERRERAVVAAVLMAFVSYFVHGFLNNFLDQDKAAIPFWAFAALLLVMDVRNQLAAEEKSLSSSQ